MTTDEHCEKVVNAIADGHYNHSSTCDSGFSFKGKIQMIKSLKQLVDAIKEEIKQELKNEQD